MKADIYPLVSVIMSTYKEPLEWVQQAVESILQQTYTNIEIIIVLDDPKNRPVIEYINSISDVIVIKNKINIGLVRSLNEALKRANGIYIARMDADDISNLDRIEKQMLYLQQNDLDLCGSNIEMFDKENVVRSRLCIYDKSLKRVLKYEGGIPHPTWICKKEIYEELNGYRNVDTCEDYDFLTRAALKGYVFGNLKEATLRYRDNRYSVSHVKQIKQLKTARLIGESYKKGKELELEYYLKCDLNSNSLMSKISVEVYKIKRRLCRRLIYELEQYKAIW